MARRPGHAGASRRDFLRLGGGLAGGAALAFSPLGRLLASAGSPAGHVEGYGPLRPVRDRTTGLPLLWLPAGFEYASFGWAGEPLMDGTPTPRAHDGMGIVRTDGNVATLVRNHELVRADGGFGPQAARYDRDCAGGTVTLRFDLAAGKPIDAWPSLSGTLQNCSGGVTPWGSWLSCEELVSSMAHPPPRGLAGIRRDHGFVFEVPAEGVSDARPLPGLGQFRHEAAVVHAASGGVYLTEDVSPIAGFYRFVPDSPGRLSGGGRLQMLAAAGHADLRRGVPRTPMKVRWIDIPEPTRGVTADGDIRGVQLQGLAGGASRFTRLEGCFAGEDDIFFTATDGGDARSGQVFAYSVGREELRLVYESASADVLHYPDNVCISPRGGLVLCQDSTQPVQHLHGLTMDGGLFPFARNAVVLDGSVRGPAGDYRRAEWAGACFSADGRWLFANIYSPGFSVAITGPWGSGLL